MIDTEEKLLAYLPVVKTAKWLAVDTEADSLHAYPEKVCLIQISTDTSDRLVDPLARMKLAPLLEALGGHELIMHGADYDLRLLRKHHDFVPRAIFDTMLAARLLGLKQFGLGHLVEIYLGVKLEKGAQKANWAMRPLTERMEKYARNDTHYLKPLSDRLKEQLAGAGRLDWQREWSARLIQDSGENHQDEAEVWRIKGSHLLSRPALAILREIWNWRESEAIRANRPPFFILSHETAVAISAAAVANEYTHLFPKHFSDRRRAALQDAVQRGMQRPPEQHPKLLRPKSRRIGEAERRRFAELEKRRNTAAQRLGIDPTVIASRATLSELAQNWEKFSPGLMVWQRGLLQP